MHKDFLFPLIRGHLSAMIGGYLQCEQLSDLDSYVCPPALYPDSGLMGGALLAREALRRKQA